MSSSQLSVNVSSINVINVKVLIKAKRLPAGVSEDDEIEDEDDDQVDEKNKKKKISKKLSDLVNYIHAVHFNGFDDEGKRQKKMLLSG